MAFTKQAVLLVVLMLISGFLTPEAKAMSKIKKLAAIAILGRALSPSVLPIPYPINSGPSHHIHHHHDSLLYGSHGFHHLAGPAYHLPHHHGVPPQNGW